jgi:hypothetical protein
MNINGLHAAECTGDSRNSILIPKSDTGQMKTKKAFGTPKSGSKESGWKKTQYANLVRYVSSGTLFARFKVRGKLIRRSLETTDLAVAKRALNDLITKESATRDFLLFMFRSVEDLLDCLMKRVTARPN